MDQELHGQLNGIAVKYDLNRGDLRAIRFQHTPNGKAVSAEVVGATGKTATMVLNDFALGSTEAMVFFKVVDPISDRVLDQAIYLNEIESIELTGVGLNQNPKNGRAFPSDYQFDPFDGTPLKPIKAAVK